MILLIDNYDSFSYNLYQLVGMLNPDIQVVRNDALTVEEIIAQKPEAVIISPGPGRPENAGVSAEAARRVGMTGIPVLGVCLGHQAICQAFGATVGYASELMHGKQSIITLDLTSPLFRGLPEQIPAARYHSLAAEEATIPDTLRVIAKTGDGEIMAVQHISAPIYGVQFHPESILTPDGVQILKNFLSIGGQTS
ncbi:MAG: aminodeoxychorismate/anthranilate synthase component II [Oscillospiraceae bacterium]|nr:aminodeoxychorismate/anthranilate synthase component II [Oscillospiraceae bacterium]